MRGQGRSLRELYHSCLIQSFPLTSKILSSYKQGLATPPLPRNSVSAWNCDLNSTDATEMLREARGLCLMGPGEGGRKWWLGPGMSILSAFPRPFPSPVVLCIHHFQICTLKSQLKCYPVLCAFSGSPASSLEFGSFIRTVPASPAPPNTPSPHIICPCTDHSHPSG